MDYHKLQAVRLFLYLSLLAASLGVGIIVGRTSQSTRTIQYRDGRYQFLIYHEHGIIRGDTSTGHWELYGLNGNSTKFSGPQFDPTKNYEDISGATPAQ